MAVQVIARLEAPDQPVEGVEREVLGLAGLLVAAGGLEGVAGAGAVDQDALLAVRRAGLGEK